MTIHLDASFLIRAMEGAPHLIARMDEWTGGAVWLSISAIAWSEFACGPLQPGQHRDARTLLGEPLPFFEADAELSAQLYNSGGRRRGSLADCQIAAIAIRAHALLATGNVADFARFAPAGLMLAPT